jgi:hypothetical protein
MSNDKAMRKMEDRGEYKESHSGDTGKGGEKREDEKEMRDAGELGDRYSGTQGKGYVKNFGPGYETHEDGKGGPHQHMNDGPEKKAHHVIAKKMR